MLVHVCIMCFMLVSSEIRAVARNTKKGGLDCTRAKRAAKIFGPRPLFLTTPIN